jgi:hypothetical protein
MLGGTRSMRHFHKGHGRLRPHTDFDYLDRAPIRS